MRALRGAAHDIDVVVTDYSMPELSGIDLARSIKELRPNLPVILTSGYIDDELQLRAREVGIRRVLYKPDTIEQLCTALQTTIAEMRSHSAESAAQLDS